SPLTAILSQPIKEFSHYPQAANNAPIRRYDPPHSQKKGSLPLLVMNYLLLFVGSVSATLLSKYHFIHKGSSIWVATWVQCAGFPLLLPPIILPYFLNLTTRRHFTQFTSKIFSISIFVGLMLGLNNLLFSVGNSNLPVSTSSLLLSSQLVFNLLLFVLIVKQKVTFSNLNCVILLTVSSILLALGSSHDKPPGLTRGKYFFGFFSTIGAGLLFALYLPIMEKVYRKVATMEAVMEAAATALSTALMVWNGAFGGMVREGREVFEVGALKEFFQKGYYKTSSSETMRSKKKSFGESLLKGGCVRDQEFPTCLSF
ncbi:probable purine permease 4, partial [Rosa rugosa]|uniref:probable purine permease 4 n=1 Tax=Rosa rugosa TaxID=74645 RepID=UPI002B402362